MEPLKSTEIASVGRAWALGLSLTHEILGKRLQVPSALF
jgi:hypothetical protein